jgi:hypothetical protein
MATVQATENTPIAEGQWICRTPTIMHALCSAPYQVTRVAGKRIHFRDGEADSWLLSKSVLFVCDTKEEAAAVYAVSCQRAEAMIAAIHEIDSKHLALIDGLIESPAVAA